MVGQLASSLCPVSTLHAWLVIMSLTERTFIPGLMLQLLL